MAWLATSRPAPNGAPLVLDERLPRPGRDAGSNALLSHAAALQRLGFAVTLVGTEHGTGRRRGTDQPGVQLLHRAVVLLG